MKTYTLILTLSDMEIMHNALTFQASELATLKNSRFINEDVKSNIEKTIEELSLFAEKIFMYHKHSVKKEQEDYMEQDILNTIKFIKFMKVGDK